MSLLAVTVQPALEPVSLAEARAHCRVTSNDEDGLLAGYLIAARTHVENQIGRALITRTYAQKFDNGWPTDLDGSRLLQLRRPPLQSVTSITYIDSTGVSQTLAANQYQVVVDDIYGHVVEAYGVTWPAVRAQPDAITVTFKAGYGDNPGDVPEPLRLAVLMLVGHYYDNREAVSVGSTPFEMPYAVQALLGGYVTDFL